MIGCDFRNQIGVIIISRESRTFTIKKGQRVAQMLIIKAENVRFEQTDTLTDPKRGQGGFGSTGA